MLASTTTVVLFDYASKRWNQCGRLWTWYEAESIMNSPTKPSEDYSPSPFKSSQEELIEIADIGGMIEQI